MTRTTAESVVEAAHPAIRDSRVNDAASPVEEKADTGMRELFVVIIGGMLVGLAWLSHVFEQSLPVAWLGDLLNRADAATWALCLLSVPLTSMRTSRRALEAVLSFKVDVDVLMFVAAAGAAAIDHVVEGAFLLFLFGLGATGEHMAMRRAERSLRSLEALAPEHAERLSDDGTVAEVPIGELVVGELVRVRPYDRVPCDAQVHEGTSAFDEATLTGEPIPVEKTRGDSVFAGTLNTGAAIVIRVTRPASESALARVIAVVTEARARRASVELVTERIERWYAPMILVASAFVFLVPTLIWHDASTWFYRAMAFLTAASPCALAIGAPATYLCGVAGGARRGIVFKGGESLESLAKVKAIALDKTGTITTGKPRVHAVKVLNGASEDEVVGIAAALEAQASHPLADAICTEADRRSLEYPSAESVTQHAGLGVSGMIHGKRTLIGSPRVMEGLQDAEAAQKIVHDFSSEGLSVVVVTQSERVVGVIGVGDQIRADAGEAVTQLKEHGLRLMMITGDHTESAAVIARQVGLDEFYAEQSPEDKMARLEEVEHDFGPVAMVGDGANDAPALARATVSLSMGNAASDVAADNADIAIMGERLVSVVEAYDFARRSSLVMRENLIIALGVICIVAPLAVVGIADLGPAVVLHEGSTVVVVLNALRLLRRSRAPT